jgi:pseudomonalisin
MNTLPILLAALLLCLLSACGGGSKAVSQAPALPAAIASTEAAIDANQAIHTVFSLKFREPEAVDRYIQQMHTLGHENYRRTLTPSQIAARFSPGQVEVDMVTSFLRTRGFSNIKVSRDNLLVEGDAPANMVSSALQTTLSSYAMQDGKRGYANTSAIILPASLSSIVLEVTGLDTVTQVHAMSHVGALSNSAAGAVGHDPTEFQAIYNVGTTPSAKNITVGIIGVGNMEGTFADLRRYEVANGLPFTPISVNYSGSIPSPDSPWKQEMNLDSQSIVGMAGGLQKLEFYSARSTLWTDMLLAIATAVDSNTARVVNMSFGSCEGSAPRAAVNQYLQKAVLQGQTFVAASGDEGSNAIQCPNFSISYPASSPYVLSVGGTTLLTDGAGTYGSEMAWGGSGGGVSQSENIPFWQVTAQNLSGSLRRQLPDVAFVADPDTGATIIIDGQRHQLGGTSLSAPLFVATWARMLSQCPELGFAAPTIYAFRNLNGIMFRDIVSGSNGNFKAGAEWDHVTGWGTPNIQFMWATMCPTGASYYKLAQQLYLAYLGRPVDPSGLVNVIATLRQAGAPNDIVELQQAYASNPLVRTLVDCLQDSAESRAVYPTRSPSAYVAALFQALAGRAPSAQESSYYVNAVQAGSVGNGGLALHIMANIIGANNASAAADRVSLNNRVAIAGNFTATLSPFTATSYVGDKAAGLSRSMLQKVQYDASYLFDQQATIQPMYIVDFQPTVMQTINSIVTGPR